MQMNKRSVWISSEMFSLHFLSERDDSYVFGSEHKKKNS